MIEKFIVTKITWDELTKMGYPSMTDYCRFLVKEGNPLPDRIEIYRGEMLCMTITDVAETAKWDVLENKEEGPRFVKYKDKTMSEETKARLAFKRPRKGVRADR